MDRAFRDDTIAAIATLKATTANLGDTVETMSESLCDRMDQGFNRMEKAFLDVGGTLDKMNDILTTHATKLQSLTEREERSRKIVKWVAGIVAAVIGALLVKWILGG